MTLNRSGNLVFHALTLNQFKPVPQLYANIVFIFLLYLECENANVEF